MCILFHEQEEQRRQQHDHRDWATLQSLRRLILLDMPQPRLHDEEEPVVVVVVVGMMVM